MAYFNGYPAVYENIKTKKDLKERMATNPVCDFRITDMGVEGYATIYELPRGAKLSVTNHPKRSWFATIELVNGKVKVS